MSELEIRVKRLKSETLPEIIPILNENPMKKRKKLEEEFDSLSLEPTMFAFVKRPNPEERALVFADSASDKTREKMSDILRRGIRERTREIKYKSLKNLRGNYSLTQGELVLDYGSDADCEDYDLVEIPFRDPKEFDYVMHVKEKYDTDSEVSGDSDDSNWEQYHTNDYPDEESSSEDPDSSDDEDYEQYEVIYE